MKRGVAISAPRLRHGTRSSTIVRRPKFKLNHTLYIRIAYTIILLLLILIPFLIFGTSLHADGDDSHLYFDYPQLWLNNIANSSWMSVSSVGKQDQQYFLWPILLIFDGIRLLHVPAFVIQDLSLSLILILGFVFFQKLFKELVPDDKDYSIELIFGASFYIFSPVLLYTPLKNYLAGIWLIGVVPLLGFLLIRYIKTGKILYLCLSGLTSALFAIAINAIPWLAGLILPLCIGLLFTAPLFSLKEKFRFLKKVSVWGGIVFLCQCFWLIPFIASLRGGASSLGSRIFTGSEAQSFSSTVATTDKGNTIIDPLLNLFHRNFISNFDPGSYYTFSHWYNYLVSISSSYILILLIGFLLIRKLNHRIFILFYSAFLFALFLFTVRIGALEQIFFAAGSIPGFDMFRNFYDKFALGYVFLYASAITAALITIKTHLRHSYFRIALISIGLLAIGLNAIPFFQGRIINSNLQGTANVKRNVTIPKEYLSFMQTMGTTLPKGSNVFDIPYGTSSYSVIAQPNSSHAYSGLSPVKLFSGINDFSGDLSFPSPIADQVNSYIINRNYAELKNTLSALHINYILQTNNIPSELLNSSIYNSVVLSKTDSEFRSQMLGSKVLVSSHGNYVLYHIKNTADALPSSNFVAVAQSYKSSPSLLASNTSLLGGAVGYLINATHTVISGPSAKLLPTNATVESYSPGGQIKNEANSEIYAPHNDTYKIMSNSGGKLYLQNLADNAYYGLAATKTISTSSNDTEPIELLRINNTYYSSSEINGALVRNGDSITPFTKGPELSGGTTAVLNHWQSGNCTPGGKESNISVTGSQNNSEIDLTSKNQQNACIFTGIKTTKFQAYQISFEYKTSLGGVNLEITQQKDKNSVSQVTALPYGRGKSGQWNTYTYTFEAQEGEAHIYLLSGKSAEPVTTSFRSIQLLNYSPSPTVIATGLTPSLENGLYLANKSTIIPVTASMVPIPSTEDWLQGDCNALNQESLVIFSPIVDTNTIQLSAKNGHNACLRTVSDINSHFAYKLSFDYYSTNVTGDFITAYQYGPNFPAQKYEAPRTQKRWEHISINLETPQDASNLTLYLYSGENSLGNATVKYKNVTITAIPQTFTDNLLITPSGMWNVVPSVKSSQLSPNSYKINVSGAKSSFFLSFLQPYSNGWQLSSSSNHTKTILRHVIANNFTNGWYVDPAALCKASTANCKKLSNGTYDIQLNAYFAPQRWFYIGATISIVILLLCLGYVIYYFRSRRSSRHLKNTYRAVRHHE